MIAVFTQVGVENAMTATTLSIRPTVASPGGGFLTPIASAPVIQDREHAAHIERNRTYRFELGDGNEYTIDVGTFQTSYRARDLLDAIEKARKVIRARASSPRENTVRISDTQGSLAWTPTMESMRD